VLFATTFFYQKREVGTAVSWQLALEIECTVRP